MIVSALIILAFVVVALLVVVNSQHDDIGQLRTELSNNEDSLTLLGKRLNDSAYIEFPYWDYTGDPLDYYPQPHKRVHRVRVSRLLEEYAESYGDKFVYNEAVVTPDRAATTSVVVIPPKDDGKDNYALEA